jgi:synaptotagmin-7
LIGVISTLGIIVLLLILLAAAYFWWRHKRSQLEFVEPTDENETSSGSLKFQQLLETQQQEQLLLEQQKQQKELQKEGANQPNNINRKLNGFLNLKTPLIG